MAYSGLATRSIAFGVDGAAINGAALGVAAVVALGMSLVHTPNDVEKFVAVCGAVAYVLWLAGYFVVFWSTTGQTPGDRLLGIRVRDAASDEAIGAKRAVLRLGALMLAAIPLMAGFLLILFDDRRRGLHDVLARTVVVDAPVGVQAPALDSRLPP